MRIKVFMREERRVGVGVGVGHIFIAEQITAYPGAFARMAAFYLPLLSRVIVNAWEEIAEFNFLLLMAMYQRGPFLVSANRIVSSILLAKLYVMSGMFRQNSHAVHHGPAR